MMNATSECPSATIASAISAATSASVRPGTRNSGTRACTRSIAAPALRSASISAASLIIRSRRSTSVASTGTTPSTSASGSRCSAGIESVTGDGERVAPPARRPPPGTGRRRPPSPAPRYRVRWPRTPSARPVPSAAPRSVGSPVRGQHQRGQPFEGLRARADQVAQVVAGRDDQPGQARVGCGRRCGAESLRVHVGAETARCHGTQANRGPNSWRPRSGCRPDRGSSATSSARARRVLVTGPSVIVTPHDRRCAPTSSGLVVGDEAEIERSGRVDRARSSSSAHRVGRTLIFWFPNTQRHPARRRRPRAACRAPARTSRWWRRRRGS